MDFTRNYKKEAAISPPLLSAIGEPVGQASAGRGRRVAIFIVAICMINLFDLALTMQAHADGMLDEQNPIARSILKIGPAALSAFKLAVIAGAGYVLFSFRRHRCTEFASIFVLIAYVAVALRWRLCYALYDFTASGAYDSGGLVLASPMNGLVGFL